MIDINAIWAGVILVIFDFLAFDFYMFLTDGEDNKVLYYIIIFSFLIIAIGIIINLKLLNF